jgi:glutathione S-transferase
MNNNLPLLITIGPSHYCDKARWALDYFNIKYKEDPHPPLFHLGTTLKYKTRTVPLLITDDGIFKDSTDILQYLDKKAPDKVKLYPQDINLRKEVEELEELFDTKLGPHSRRWAYFYLFQTTELIFKIFNTDIHPMEESLFETFYPVIKPIMKKAMKISPQSTERSHNKIVEVFKIVEGKMSDGRKYLTGDTLTAADITFATLAAPVVYPRGYIKNKAKKTSYFERLDKIERIEAGEMSEVQVNEFEDFPELMIEEIKEFRKMPAGIFARELYQNQRFKKASV